MEKKIHLIGNAHLDPIWLWRWQEGCAEVLQTFRSAADRLKEYDDFVFTCSSAAYYKWVEEIDPELFEEIVKFVKEGRWVPVNGWWVQPDCNIPSGESFARQALYSQLYYYEKFGRICKTGYNVDSFGHNGNLPQLLNKGGMTNYVFHRPSPNENDTIPKLFIWKSQDDSKVLAFHIIQGYGESGDEGLDRRMEYADSHIKEYGHSIMLFYGVGNHGGGPTRGDIEHLIKNMKAEGRHDLQFSSPDTYFDALRAEMPDLPIWTKDLQHHASGCYSATSMVKQLNRQAENSLYYSEAFSTLANKGYGMKPATSRIKEAWQEVCFNQFHDILCGCSVKEAYDDVRVSEGHAIDLSEKIYNEALLRICKKIDTWVEGVSDPVCEVRNWSCNRFPRPIVIFNPLSFDVEVPVRVYQASHEVKDSEGNYVPFQNVRSSRSNDTHLDTCVLAKVPALGYATYWMTYMYDEDNYNDIKTVETDLKAEKLTMENEFIKVKFSEKTGFIESLIDKKSGFDYASEQKPVAVPTVIDDRETDTWAHNVFTFHKIKGIMELESIELIEKGPARAVIRTIHKFGESHLHQDFILGAKAKTIRVKCKAIWQENFTMLKMSFPVDGVNAENIYEIPAGYIKKPTNGEEEPSGKWAGISFANRGNRHSLAILNDSKYSYDSVGNDFRITLLRNVILADHYSSRPAADFNFTDEGKQYFEYGIYVTEGELEKSDVMNEAYKLNVKTFNVPVSYHKGPEKQVKSFIHCDKDNVIMTAMKLSEDGSGDVIMRFYETRGIDTRVNIICDIINCAFIAEFSHNEIKTFRVDKNGKVTEENFLEGIVKPG